MANVPTFRRLKPPPMKNREAREHRERFRGSARERGYTTEWDHLRNDYIENNPLCEEHLRRGFVLSAEVVDHMIPISEDPSGRLNSANLDSLCHDCHNNWKRRIERFARQTDQTDQLRTWVKNPKLRPGGFQIRRTGPVKEDGTLETLD